MRPDAVKAVVSYTLAQSGEDEPWAGLEDIQPRLLALSRHWVEFNRSEERIQEQQRGLIRDRCMIMPSPFGDAADRSDSSYFSGNRFFYRFEGAEEYFWITSDLSGCYALATVYFPERAIAVDLYPHFRDVGKIAAFEEERSKADVPSGARASEAKPLVVSGFHHMAHVMWNDLPALEAAERSLSGLFDIAVSHQPLGPLKELFPDFIGEVSTFRYENLTDLNASARLKVGLGSWSITQSMRERVRKVASRHAYPAQAAARAKFKREHAQILWVSVKPHRRTVSDQASVLAEIISTFHRKFPKAGYIIDGACYPWDFAENTNYDWCRELLRKAELDSALVLKEIVALLGSKLRPHVVVLNGVSVCDEIGWGELPNFYFCHGGTMQHKIGWLHDVPGIVHSNSKFTQFQLASVVKNGSACLTLPSELVVDDGDDQYTATELERKDQNYHFRSVPRVAAYLIDAFRAHASPGAARTERRA